MKRLMRGSTDADYALADLRRHHHVSIYVGTFLPEKEYVVCVTPAWDTPVRWRAYFHSTDCGRAIRAAAGALRNT